MKNKFQVKLQNNNLKKLVMSVIEIEDLQFYAYHGCYNEEKVVGDNFRVWMRLEGNFDKAARTDALEDALDYQKAVAVVKREMGISSNLLENLTNRILEGLHREFGSLEKATVKVSKLNPPVGAQLGSVSVTLSR